MEIKRSKKNSMMVTFSDHLKDNQVCDITEWANGEGFDVSFEDKTIALTHAEFHAMCGLGNLMLSHIGD
jgi:hypothetical protein